MQQTQENEFVVGTPAMHLQIDETEMKRNKSTTNPKQYCSTLAASGCDTLSTIFIVWMKMHSKTKHREFC